MIFLFRVLIILILSCSVGWTQNQFKIDSLLNELKTAKDTKKVDVLNGLAWEYRHFQPAKTIENGEKSLELAMQLKYDKGIALALRSIGIAYRVQLDFTKAQKYFFHSLVYEEKTRNKLGIAQCFISIGEVYKYRGNYKEALTKYNRALKLYEELKEKKGTVIALSGMADVFYRWAKYKDAVKFAKQSMALANEIGTNEGIMESSLILSDSYARTGNFREAYKLLNNNTKLKDSITLSEKTREIEQLERRFANELKETEMKMIREKQAEQAKIVRERKNNIQYSLIFVIFVGLFFAIFTFSKYDIPNYVLDGMIFVTMLTFFRFILLAFMPLAETQFGGGPLVTLATNVIIGLMLLPFHKYFESKLKSRIYKSNIGERKPLTGTDGSNDNKSAGIKVES